MSDVLETNAPALSATSDFPKASEPAPAANTPEPAPPPEPVEPAPKEPTVDEIIQDDAPIDPNRLRKADLQSRFRDLTQAEKTAKAERDAALARVQEYEAREQAAAREAEERRLGAPKPAREQFDDPDAYDAAVIAWAAARAEKAGYEKATQERQATEAQRSQQEAFQTFNTRLEAARAETPDFQAVALDPTLPVSQVMTQVIMRSENGPQMLYHLGQNRALAQKIANMGPIEAALEMGRLSATVGDGKKLNISRAAPPISRVQGRTTTTRQPDEMSGDEYYAMRQAQERDRRANR